ncbi:MAG: N-acyl-D-amino-acid deacylase family protein [bacterium]
MFDLLIKGGRVVAGSGDPWYYADVAVSGDRIAAIGCLKDAQARQVIDAAGKVVCPGFIDMHSHSDVLLLANPKHEPKIMQGVTTEVLGLDGLSYAPLSPANLQMMRIYLAALNGNPDNIDWDWSSVSEYLAKFDRQVATNVAYLLPHNALRLETIGFYDRQATPTELAQMQKIVAQAMEEGAVGVSFGLDYYPGRYGNIEELIAICEAVAEYDGISEWHLRNRDLGLMAAIDEALTVGAKTKVKLHFSHFAANGVANKGKGKEMLALVDEARERGFGYYL